MCFTSDTEMCIEIFWYDPCGLDMNTLLIVYSYPLLIYNVEVISRTILLMLNIYIWPMNREHILMFVTTSMALNDVLFGHENANTVMYVCFHIIVHVRVCVQACVV